MPHYFFPSSLALVTHAENTLVLILPALGKDTIIFHFLPFPSILHPHLRFRFCFTLHLPANSIDIFLWVLWGIEKLHQDPYPVTTGFICLQVYSTAKCLLLHCTGPTAKINPSLLSLKKQPWSITICNLLYHPGCLAFPVWIRK